MTNLSRTAVIIFGIVFAIFSLLLLMPLGSAAAAFGVNARHSQGTIMSGALRDASLGGIRIGDVNAKLRFLPLFSGHIGFALKRGDAADAPGVSGSIGTGFSGIFADRLTASIDGRGLGSAMEGSDIRLKSLSVAFSNGRCTSASGVVRLSLDDTPLGSMIRGGLMGNAQCSNGDLLLPLLSDSTMEKAFVRLKGDGNYQITFMVLEPTAETAAALGFAGFQPAAGGLRLVRSGKFN